jgi:hypothetical protein
LLAGALKATEAEVLPAWAVPMVGVPGMVATAETIRDQRGEGAE